MADGLSGGLFSYDPPDLPMLGSVARGVGNLQVAVHHATAQKSRLEPPTLVDQFPDKYTPSLDLSLLTGLLGGEGLKNLPGADWARVIVARAKTIGQVKEASKAVLPELDDAQKEEFVAQIAEETDEKFNKMLVMDVTNAPDLPPRSGGTVYQTLGAQDKSGEDEFDDDLGLVPIGGPIGEARQRMNKAKGDLDAARAELKAARRELREVIRHKAFKGAGKFFRGVKKRGGKAGRAVFEEEEIPSTTLSLRATGIMGKGEQVTKTEIGGAFHSVVLGFAERNTENARQMASNFVGHRFGIDTEDDRMVDIKPDGSRIIKAVVGRTEDGTPVTKGVLKMESWGFNDNLSHTVSTVGSDVGKIVSNGDAVDEGGFVLTVIGDEVELAGSYGAENRDSKMPKGTKIYHGHIVIGQKDDEAPAMVLLVRTMDPVRSDSSKDGALTFKMTGDHLLHNGDPVEITRKISTATKNGKKTVTVSTDIKSSS